MNLLDQQLMQIAAAEELARLERFRRAWDAYYGRHKKTLRVKPGQPDDNVVVNKARVIVDKGVSFLFGQDVRWELDETGENPAEQYLDAAWAANRRMTLLQKLAMNGAVCGHAFVKIVPPLPGQPYPRLVVLDPATVTVRWEPDDIETVTYYRIQFSAVDPATGKPMAQRQLIERDGAAWRITDQVSEAGSNVWQTVGQAVWPHPWPPILDCQNLPQPNCFWGISDLEDDVLALNRARNFTISNWLKIQRYHGHPRTWGRGFAASQIESDPEKMLVFPNADAELRNLEMQSDQAGAANLDRRLDEALHEISRVPAIATGKVENVGQLSGLALQILYQPLIEKTETKRRLYGDLVVELNRRLLALAGYGEDNVTVLHWPELLPSDPLQERQALLLDQQLGVSSDTLLDKLGYDPEQEAQKRAATTADLGSALLSNFERGGA